MSNDTSALRALVVDDEMSIRRLTVRALSRVGFECDEAADGLQAQLLAHSRCYHVIVTDLRMPVRNGHKLCVELLEMDDRPLIVVLTGVMESRLYKDLMSRGVDDVFYKPVEYLSFAKKLRAMVDLHRCYGPHPAPETASAGTPSSLSEPPPAGTSAPSPAEKRATSPPPLSALEEDAAETRSSASSRSLPAAAQDWPVAVLLLSDAGRSRQLGEALAGRKIRAVSFSASDGLYHYLQRERVDIVLLENELGGFLSGLEILERLEKDLLHPEAILLASPNDSLQKVADRLGVYSLIPPASDDEYIAEAVQNALIDQQADLAFIPRAARQWVQNCGDIPPMPQVVLKLLTYLNMELADIPLKQLAADISVDPKATSNLLTLTNSVSTGVRRNITNVFDALTLLGAKRAIALILASAMSESKADLTKDWSDPLRKWYHFRSVLIANISAVFSEELGDICPDTAFVLGLLQEVGILVMARNFGARYLQMLDRLQRVGPLQLHCMEQEEYGLSHAEVSAALLSRWELPKSLVGLVLDHHCPRRIERKSLTEQTSICMMQIGEGLADLFDVPHPLRRQRLNGLFEDFAPLTADDYRRCVREAVSRAKMSCQLFSVSMPPDQSILQLLRSVSLLAETSSEELQTAEAIAEA